MQVHTGIQVVLHETDRPHPLVPELDHMVVAQMSRLGLSQFINMPTNPHSAGAVRLAETRGSVSYTRE